MWDHGLRFIKQYMHILVPPAFVQRHAMRLHPAEMEKRPVVEAMYTCSKDEVSRQV